MPDGLRYWVLQIGVGPLPVDQEPGQIRELDELEGRVRAVLPDISAIVVNRFIADSEGERVSLLDVLTFHQRRDDGGCTCGWGCPGEPARALAEHVAGVFEESVRVRSST